MTKITKALVETQVGCLTVFLKSQFDVPDLNIAYAVNNVHDPRINLRLQFTEGVDSKTIVEAAKAKMAELTPLSVEILVIGRVVMQ